MWLVFTCGPRPVASWVLSLCSLDAATNWHLNVFLYLFLSEASADELCTPLTAQTWNLRVRLEKSAGENDFWFGLCSLGKPESWVILSEWLREAISWVWGKPSSGHQGSKWRIPHPTFRSAQGLPSVEAQIVPKAHSRTFFFPENANPITQDSYCLVLHTITKNKNLKESVLTKMFDKMSRQRGLQRNGWHARGFKVDHRTGHTAHDLY